MGKGPGNRRGPALVALTTPIAFLSAASMAGTLLMPVLAPAHPLLLVALSPRTPNLALASSKAPLWAFLAIGLLRLAAADPWHFLLGRHGGEQVTAWTETRSPRLARTLVRTQRFVGRLGVAAVALRPNGPVLAAAGACRLSPVLVAVADAAGTATYLFAVYGVGQALATPLDRLLGLVPAHVLVAGLAAALALCGFGYRRRRGGGLSSSATIARALRRTARGRCNRNEGSPPAAGGWPVPSR